MKRSLLITSVVASSVLLPVAVVQVPASASSGEGAAMQGTKNGKNAVIVGSVDSTKKHPFEVGTPKLLDVDAVAVGGKILKKRHWKHHWKSGWLDLKKSPKGQDIQLIDKIKKVRPAKRPQWECSKYWYDLCRWYPGHSRKVWWTTKVKTVRTAKQETWFNNDGPDFGRGTLFGGNAKKRQWKLAGRNLSGLNLSWAPLVNSDFTGANLSDTYFENTDLSGSDFTGADLSDTYFENTDLSGVTLSDTDLMDASFHKMHLPRVNLSGANMAGTDLSDAHLSDVDLTNTKMQGTNLNGTFSTTIQGKPASLPNSWSLISGHLIGPGASLENVDLSGADLSGVNLENVKLAGTNLSGVVSGGVQGAPASLPKKWSLFNGYLMGPGASLENINLSGINLPGMNLSGANLRGANMRHAYVVTVDLTGADLRGADLTGATLNGASLTGANLSGATTTDVRWSNLSCPDGSQVEPISGTCNI